MEELGISTEQINEWTTKLGEMAIEMGGSVLGALGILILGWVIAAWVQRSVRRALDRTELLDATLKPLIASIVRYTILAFVVVAVLAQFGVQTTSIIAVLGAAGLAIGLALQGTLANIASGVMLLILRPLKIDEYISVGGQEGTVEEVGLFTTILKTFDGIYISIPNSQIWGQAIKNFSRNSIRRIDLVVGIGYDDDVKQGLKVLLKVLEKDKRFLSEPTPPQTMVKSLGDSSVNINMRGWVNKADYWDVLFDLTRDSKLELDKAGLSIPFPQRDVHIFPTEQAIAVKQDNKKAKTPAAKSKKKKA